MRCCGNCFKPVAAPSELTTTREGYRVCKACLRKLHHCEVCGSVKPGEEDQLHYEEECFK